MLKGLKRFVWNWRDEIYRFNVYNGFLMRMSEPFGFRLRGKIIPRYFGACGDNITINEGVRFRGIHKIKAGDNLSIGVDAFLQASGGLTIGDHVVLGPGVKIWTINHRFAATDRPIREQGFDYDPVVIGNDVWLGANTFIFPGVNLPDGCVVSACSAVAKKRYPPYAILAGYPARVIGNRRQLEPVAT